MREEIMAFIKKAIRRMRNQHFIEYTIVGLMFSLIGCLMLLLISLGITIPYANEKGIGIILVGMIICELYTVVKMPKPNEVTLRVDQIGLEERLSTALMLIDSEELLSKLQRQDTLVHIQNYDLKKHFPYHCSIKKIGINILLIVACIGVCMIPTKAKQKENELRLFQKEKQELMEQMDEQIEKLEDIEELSALTKEELANLLEKSKKEIPKSQNENEVKKSMDRLAKKLDNLAKENKRPKEQEAIHQINKTLTEPFQKKAQQEAQSDLETLSETLSKNEWTHDLAESLKQENLQEDGGEENNSDEQLEEALKELEEQIQEMSEVEKQALANTLSQLATNLNSEQLASQLSQVSSSLANGTLNTQNLQAALKNLKQMAMSNANNTSQSSSQYQSSNNGNGQQGNNNNSGNGSGQGNGSGNSNSSGNGQGASGQGTGNGQGGGWNTGSQHGIEKGSTGNKVDQIPETNPGYDANLSGKVDESNQMEQGEIAYGINIAGQKVDYHSVVGDYTEEALENIEQEAVPEHMKDAIKDYFEAINQ